jgi:hypothetical protein
MHSLFRMMEFFYDADYGHKDKPILIKDLVKGELTFHSVHGFFNKISKDVLANYQQKARQDFSSFPFSKLKMRHLVQEQKVNNHLLWLLEVVHLGGRSFLTEQVTHSNCMFAAISGKCDQDL